MSKKTVAIVGGIAGLLGLGWLITRARAVTYNVKILSNPIKTAILVDDKEVVTPQILALRKGKHTFKAVSKSPNLLLTYGFHKWSVNGIPASYQPTSEINITGPSIVVAYFQMIEAGVYPIMEI